MLQFDDSHKREYELEGGMAAFQFRFIDRELILTILLDARNHYVMSWFIRFISGRIETVRLSRILPNELFDKLAKILEESTTDDETSYRRVLAFLQDYEKNVVEKCLEMQRTEERLRELLGLGGNGDATNKG